MDSIKVRNATLTPQSYKKDEDIDLELLKRMINGEGVCDAASILLDQESRSIDIFAGRRGEVVMDYLKTPPKPKPRIKRRRITGWSYNRLKSKRRVWKKYGPQSMSYGFSVLGGIMMLGSTSALQAALISITTAFVDSPEAITSINVDDFVNVFSENPEVSIASSVGVVSTALLLTGWKKTAKLAEPALKFVFMSLLMKTHIERTGASADLHAAKEKLSTAVTDEEIATSYRNYSEAKKAVGGKMGELGIFATFAGVSAYAETTPNLSSTMGQIMCLPDDTIFLVKAGLEVGK